MKGSDEPLHLEPRPSRRLTAYLLLIHLLAPLPLLPLPLLPLHLPLPLLVMGAGATLASLLLALRHHRWRRGRGALVAARWDGDGRWWLTLADGSTREARLLGESVLLPWLLVLRFASSRWSRHTLLLLPDMEDGERLRRLRGRLLRQRVASHGSGLIPSRFP